MVYLVFFQVPVMASRKCCALWHILYLKFLEPGDICRSGVPLGWGSRTQLNLEALSGQLSQTDPLWRISRALTPAEVPWTRWCGFNMTLVNFTGTKWGRRVGHRRQGLLAFLRVFATRPVWFPEPRCQRHFGLRMQIVKLDTEEGSLIYPFGWMFLWLILRKRKNAQIVHLSPVEPKRQRASGLRVNGVGREERCRSVVVVNFLGGNTPTTAGFKLPKRRPGCGARQRCAQVQEPSPPL